VLTAVTMMPNENAALLIGPGDDDVEVLSDEDIICDDDIGPSSLDHEALTDDAC
jgi:hypothetical protein